MANLLRHSTLLGLLIAASLLGCAKTPEKPIVLHPPHPERRVVRSAVRRPPLPPAPSAAPAAGVGEAAPANTEPSGAHDLSAAEKQALFDDFDRYLARSRPPQ